MTFPTQAKHKTLARTAGSLSLLTSALLLAWPAQAQSNEELLREIRALKDRVQQLEGARTEQAQELSRVGTKAEALEDTRDAMGLKNLKISGYADPSFIVNKRQNTSGFQFLNGVGDDGYNYDNSYFGAVAIDFQKETDSGTKYRLTLIPNRGTESIASGSNGIVQEASVAVPLDSGLFFIAGHLPDWSGYEYSQPTLNKLITHNLLFDFTLPTSYTGAGLQLTSGKWIAKSVLANMNASKKAAGEKTPVLAYRADYTGGEFYGFGFAGVHGKAANFAETLDDGTGTPVALKDSRVDLFEVDAWFTRGDWNFNGQVSVGRQRKSAIATANGGLTTLDPAELLDAKWWGISGLASYKITPRLEGIVRADYLNNKKNGGGLLGYSSLDDRNGIGPDPVGNPTVGANRTAISVGMAYALDPSAVLKAEVRRDSASQPVFIDVKDGSFAKSNTLFGASVVVSF